MFQSVLRVGVLPLNHFLLLTTVTWFHSFIWVSILIETLWPAPNSVQKIDPEVDFSTKSVMQGCVFTSGHSAPSWQQQHIIQCTIVHELCDWLCLHLFISTSSHLYSCPPLLLYTLCCYTLMNWNIRCDQRQPHSLGAHDISICLCCCKDYTGGH